MYGTSESEKIQAKFMTCSNKDMTIDSDKGILRRGKIQFYKSQFLDGVNNDNWNDSILKKESNFESKSDDDEFKNAYFYLFSDYVDNLKIPEEATEQFKEMAEQSDTLQTRFYDCFAITKRETDRENKEFIIGKMGKAYDRWLNVILSMLKGLGSTYSKNKAKNGVKGFVFGIRVQ